LSCESPAGSHVPMETPRRESSHQRA
jgi:hypothetical protein